MTGRGAYAGRSLKTGPKTFGARIQAIRAAWKWTQGELAGHLNTDQQQISLYERDRALPSKPMQASLARFFGVSLEALVSGEGFTIPDLPHRYRDPGQSTVFEIQLPVLDAGELFLVTLPAMESQALSFAQGQELLKKAKRTKAKVWLVVESE